MSERTIANLIKELRKENNISRNALCEGLCDKRTLTKLEAGEGVPNILLVDRLLQRLGKSPDMFEVVISDEEYDSILARDEIQEALDEEDFKKTRMLLSVYYKKFVEPITIQQQFYYQMLAILEKCEGNHEKCIELLNRSLENTLPNFSIGEERETLLCVIEIELLIMLADEYYALGQKEKANEMLSYLIQYIEDNYTDKGEIVKIYPKAVYLFTSKNYSKESCARHIEKCEKAFNYMIEEGTTIFLAEIMQLLIMLYRELDIERKARQLECQLKSLEEVYEEEGFELYSSRCNTGWFKESLRRDYYLCSELIKGQRLSLGISREEFAFGIYNNPENLARAESGTAMPSYDKFMMIMKKLGLHMGRYNGYLATDDYNVLELRKKINLLLSRHEYEDARIAVEKLRNVLDISNPINRQYLERTDAQLDYKLGVIGKEEFYNKLLEVLNITYAFDNEILRIPVKQELELLNLIGICLWEQGKDEEAVKLFCWLENKYETGKMKIEHQIRRSGVVLGNCAKALEDMDKLSEAEIMCKKGLALNIIAGKGGTIDLYLSEKACLAQKADLSTEKKKKTMKRYLIQAFFCSALYKNTKNNNAYGKFYKNLFGEEIELD